MSAQKLMRPSDQPRAHTFGRYNYVTIYFEPGTSVTWRKNHHFYSRWELHSADGPNGERLVREDETNRTLILSIGAIVLIMLLLFFIYGQLVLAR